jgi:OOP family OmpA-OmpF porin
MIKTKKVVAGVLGAIALAVAPAVAMAQSPWYAGVHIGQADIDEANDEDTAFRILGGYQINQNFAAELAYTDFGKVQGAKGNAIELVGVGSLPVANQFSVYGKLGLSRGEFKASGVSEDSIEVTYGVGVRYDVTPTVGARLEWQNYPDVGDGASDVSVLSVGVVFKF